MAIRSYEDLTHALESDLRWRREELLAIHRRLRCVQDDVERGALLRAGVALLYAHWEGFVRHAAQSYLELVADRVKRGRLGYHELAPPFAGLAMLRRLRETAPAGQRALLAEATRILRASPCESASIPTADIVSARSDLSFAVLTQLLAAIGIDTAPHATKRYIIDEGLLKARNSVAHGDYALISLDDFDGPRDEVNDMLADLCNRLLNAAAAKEYLAAPPAGETP